MDFLQRDRTVLAVVDVQERLLPAIPEERRATTLRNVLILVQTARTLGIPIVVSEQYRKGLGATMPEVREAIGDAFAPIEKMVFSCARSPEFQAALEATHRRDIIICGVEAHVCVLQSTIDLTNAGYRVNVPADAVASRRTLDWETGVRLMEKAGAAVGTTETFVFQLLERAGTEEFKTIARLVK